MHLRQPQEPEAGLHRARGAKGNYRYDAAHHLVRKSRSASKTAPTGWLSELGEITRRGHAASGAMNYHGLFPMLSMVRARRPTPPEALIGRPAHGAPLTSINSPGAPL